MPSCSGQNGMTCIRPTAPALETAQGSKRLSTSSMAITNPGGSGVASVRWVSQYTVCRICSRSASSPTKRPQLRLHQRVPHRRVVTVDEALGLPDRLLHDWAQLRVLLRWHRHRHRHGRGGRGVPGQGQQGDPGGSQHPGGRRRRAAARVAGGRAGRPAPHRAENSRSRPHGGGGIRACRRPGHARRRRSDAGCPSSSASANLTPGRASRSS